MKAAKAFSPGNITCVFAIVENKNPLKKGSLGVSFATSKGAFAEAERSKKNEIIINGEKRGFPTVQTAISFLTKEPLKIKIKTQLPIGCGYGMSGACTLASVYSVNKLLNLKKSNKELAILAHKAEVLNHTGLGTVTAELLGGFLMRDRKSMPLTAKKLKTDQKTIYYKSFGPIDTKKVITNDSIKKKINKYGIIAINKIKSAKTLEEIIKISKEFALKTGLLKDKKAVKTIEEIEKNKGAASMNMLGNSVFSNIPFKGSKRLWVSRSGARVL